MSIAVFNFDFKYMCLFKNRVYYIFSSNDVYVISMFYIDLHKITKGHFPFSGKNCGHGNPPPSCSGPIPPLL